MDSRNLNFRYIPVDEAVDMVLNSIGIPTRNVKVIPINEAFDEILAEDIVVGFDVPLSDVSHFDGYAADFKDLKCASPSNPVFLRVVDKIFPGDSRVVEIKSGEVCYVSTGSLIPRNANTVLPVEAVRLVDENLIEVRFSPRFGDHIIHRGSDLRRGEILFRAGRVLSGFDVGLLSHLGFKFVKVFVKPRIGVLSIGDELACTYFTSHALMLYYLIHKFHGFPINLGVVRDNVDEIADALREGLRKCDCIMTIGGCSRGVKDLLPNAILSLNDSKIMLRGLKRVPGRQTSFAVVGGKPILMLPGLCQSMVVGFYTLGVPLIRRLGNITSSLLFKLKAKVAEDLHVSFMLPFEHVFFVKFSGFDRLPLVHTFTGPSMHRSIVVKSNGFTVLPPFKSYLRRGEVIDVVLF